MTTAAPPGPPRTPPPPPPPPPRPGLRLTYSADRLNLSPRILLDPKEITGKSIAIMGTNGSGKSGTARKLAEEHIRLGLPFTIADIENEYATLKELGDVILAGPAVDYGSIKLDTILTNTNEFHELGRKAYRDSRTVVLLIGDLDDDTRKLYLKAYIDGIFEEANNPKLGHYYRLFLEEVQEHIPQVGLAKSDPLRQSIIRFGKRGRKRKLSLVLISQRPSNVDKDVLTQCHIFLLHFVTYRTDMDVYATLGVEDVDAKMQIMQPGDAIFRFAKVAIEDRISMPQTKSPWDEGSEFDESKFREAKGVEELQQEIIRDAPIDDSGMAVVPNSYLHKLEKQIPVLEEQVTALVETQIALEDQIATLKAREPVIVASTGDTDRDSLLEQNRQLRAERDLAIAQAVPLRLLADFIHQHNTHNQ